MLKNFVRNPLESYHCSTPFSQSLGNIAVHVQMELYMYIEIEKWPSYDKKIRIREYIAGSAFLHGVLPLQINFYGAGVHSCPITPG